MLSQKKVSEFDHGHRRGHGATPAAFYLGLCRLRGILSPPASATVILEAGQSLLLQRWCCRRAILRCSSEDAASIPKSLLPQRKLVSDADHIVATTVAGGTILLRDNGN